MKSLVLASTSRFRRELLARLKLSFSVEAPGVDESIFPGESPATAAERLALIKAQSVAARQSTPAIVIGSDQIATDGTSYFEKPGATSAARAQLRALRGRSAYFYTGICVIDTERDSVQLDHAINQVRFRDYTDEEIEQYLCQEDVLACAGSAKSEGLGISMLDAIEGSDPTALVGLPLIKLCTMLRNCSVRLP